MQLDVTFGSDSIVSKFSGYDSYYLVIYNPKDTAVSFYYAGEASSWAACGQTTLPSKSYTQIAYDSRFAAAGNAYMYSDGGATINFNDTESGWICKVYGRKTEAGAEVTIKSFGGSTSTEDYGVVWSGSGGLNTDKTSFNLWCGTLSATDMTTFAEYNDVHFFIYNPNDVDVKFFFQDDPNWKNSDITTLKAKAWTKVSVNELLALSGVKTVYLNILVDDADSFVANGWMISDFYGTAK